MALKTLSTAKIQILNVLQNFVDIHFEFPDSGNNADATTILNSGADGGFPGNARQIAFDDSADLVTVTCISMTKIQAGATLVWRVHVQTTDPTAQAVWNLLKEYNYFFASKVTSNLYIDDDL